MVRKSKELDSIKLDISANQILDGLPKNESDFLLPHLELVTLRQNEILARAGEQMVYCYFPQNAVLSMLAFMEEGVTVEVGLIGYEGLVGFHGVLGAKTWSNGADVQIPGDCLRMKMEVLQDAFNRSRVLRDRLLRYVRYFLAQVTQTAACNRVHKLESRLARWLLMCNNRAKRNMIPITHEFLANMLGTPRSEVTIAAGKLRKSGLIHYGRGHITILDRKGLESAACECYPIVEHELLKPR